MTILRKKRDSWQREKIEFGLTSVNFTNTSMASNLHKTNTKKSTQKDTLMCKVVNWLNQIDQRNVSHATMENIGENPFDVKQTKRTETIAQAWEPNDRPLLVKHKETLLMNSKITSVISSDTRPIFMFMQLKGRTRGLNLIFDSGASALVTLNSIPGKELKACKNNNQIIELQGLGSTKNSAQSWTMTLPLANNNNLVATEGYSVEHILGPLHTLEMSTALKLIKESAPQNNTEIQQAQIYEYLSGNIEILAGIRLNALFPEKIFQLENGLALYKLKLASHNPSKMFCIGGPYSCVSKMGKFFKESAHFLKEVSDGLEQWSMGNTAKLNRGITMNGQFKKTYKTQALIQHHRYNYENPITNNPEYENITEHDLQNIEAHLDETDKQGIIHCISCCDECNENTENATNKSLYNENIILTQIETPEEPNQFIKWEEQHEGRPNAFIAIKINDTSLLDTVCELQEGIITKHEKIGQDLKPYKIKRTRMHITLMVIQYHNQRKMQSLFQTAMEHAATNPFEITFESDVHQFPENMTAYIKPTDHTKNTIANIHKVLKAKMFQIDSNVKIDINDIKPHATIFKGKNNITLPNIDKYITNTENSTPIQLGKQTVLEIELLSFRKNPLTGEHIKIDSFAITNDNNHTMNCSSEYKVIFPNAYDENWQENQQRKKEMTDTKQIIANVNELIYNTPFIHPNDIPANLKHDQTNTHVKNAPSNSVLLKNLQFIFDSPEVGYRCPDCQKCNSCRNSITQEVISMKEHLEEYLIEKSVNIDRERKCFIAALPLTHDPGDTLGDNTIETKARHKRVLQKLNKNPADLKEVKTGFEKLIALGYIKKLADFPKEKQKEILSRPGKHILPWDVVTKSTSVTHHKRQIFDAGSKTNTGHALNDIICKGKPRLDFDPMVLNFVHDKYGLCADLQKFYQSVHLHEDHYHLQLMWWTENMLPTDEPELYVITRITFGLKSSSQQLEHCVKLLAEENKHKPNLYRLLTKQRFVDDLMGSYSSKGIIEELIVDTDGTLSNYGMKVKAYCKSYEKPSLTVSDGNSLVTGGMIWKPELDVLFIRIQPLHYSKKNRGQIMTDNIFENGSYAELDAFMPSNLTLRQVLSRSAQIYDPLGKVTPWKTGIKTLVRESLNSVDKTWDATLSPELRVKWVQKFWEMQLLKEIGFQRNTLPLDKVADKATLVCFCDAGKFAKLQVVYLLHNIGDDNWHSQLLYSKSQLSHPNRTIPNLELESLHNGAIILHKCYLSLPNIVKTCLIGDSTVSSYWVCKDTISLASFQRNRVADIRRLVDLDDIYHCKGDLNISDLGTKSIVPLDSILPGSDFNVGPNFLKLGISTAVSKGYLKTIKNVIINPANTDLWEKATDGLVGKCSWPDELLIGNDKVTEMMMGVNEQWVSKVSERYKYSNYLIDPLKRTWPFVIRSLSITFYFLHKLISKIKRNKLSKANDNKWNSIHQRIFNLNKQTENKNFCQTLTSLIALDNTSKQPNVDNGEKPSNNENIQKFQPNSLDQALVTLRNSIIKTETYDSSEKIDTQDKTHSEETKKRHILDIFNNGIEASFFKSIAILYYLRKGSKELENFYSTSMLKKHCYKSGNLLFSKNRWLEANQVEQLTGNETHPIDCHIQQAAPMLDRHSPTAISLAMFFHHVVSKHAGVDRSYLHSQGAVFIMQGQRLFKDICTDCITCRRKLKQKYNQTMGPLTQNQLTYTAVGRFLFLDVSGPYLVKITLNTRATRQNNTTNKVWLLHGVCIVSNYSVVQVLESYGTDSFVQAVHRISSYLGYPQIAFIDSSATEIKGLSKTKFCMYDASNKLYDQVGITIKLCATGPSSHARHGRIEKRIHLFKNYFEKVKAEISNLTALGLYTLALQAATYLNCAPLCTKKRIGGSVSSKLISANSYLIGKLSNHRAPGDIPQILEDQSQILESIETAANGMKEYFTLNIPDLLLRTTWHDDPKLTIKKGDLVLFMKHENAIEYTWKLGIINDLELDPDGEARIASISYSNSQEIDLPLSKNDTTTPKIVKRITRKSSHTIAKIHSIEDEGISSNLAYLNKVIKGLDPSSNFTEGNTADNVNHISNNELRTTPLRSDISLTYFRPQLNYLLEPNQK